MTKAADLADTAADLLELCADYTLTGSAQAAILKKSTRELNRMANQKQGT